MSDFPEHMKTMKKPQQTLTKDDGWLKKRHHWQMQCAAQPHFFFSFKTVQWGQTGVRGAQATGYSRFKTMNSCYMFLGCLLVQTTHFQQGRIWASQITEGLFILFSFCIHGQLRTFTRTTDSHAVPFILFFCRRSTDTDVFHMCVLVNRVEAW